MLGAGALGQPRDQQTKEAITEGNALEATGHRLKPCGYYELHRKGPRDLEKLGLGVQNEAGQRLIEFCQENKLVIANTFFQQAAL